MQSILNIQNLKVSFNNGKGWIQVVRGVDLSLEENKITGILGESGSGKTVSFSSVLKLIDRDKGRVDDGIALYKDRDLLSMEERALQKVRGRFISYIFQNPAQALNPYKSIGRQMTDVLKMHKTTDLRKKALSLLVDVGIEQAEMVFDMYPYQLSGGLNQRVLIAMGILLKPEIIIADEPTSSVDASLRRKILDLFKAINEKYGMAIVLITHDFDIVEYLCHNLIILYGGLVMEEGTVEDLMENPFHPYTRELIHCARSLSSGEGRLYTLQGTALNPSDFRNSCPFCQRCPLVMDECFRGIPPIRERMGRKVRCFREEV